MSVPAAAADGGEEELAERKLGPGRLIPDRNRDQILRLLN